MAISSIKVVHEEKDFTVLNKPAGILVHPPKGGDDPKGTVVAWVLTRYPEIKTVGDAPRVRPGIIHRLDKDTSGVFVIARTQKFFGYFKGLLQKHGVKKTYYALVWGHPKDKGVINKPIGLRSGSTKRSVSARKMKMVKEAVTEYRTRERFEYKKEKFAWVELSPKTGRTHQLRVHMASIGSPIVADALYGREGNPFGLKRQALHAAALEFPLPGGKQARFEVNLPKDLKDVLRLLKKSK